MNRLIIYFLFVMVTFLFYRCITKPPASSVINSKGYFEDLSFLRENVKNHQVQDSEILNSQINNSSFTEELEILIKSAENKEKNTNYINGYSIQIFSGTERDIADSIFHKIDSIQNDYKVFTFYNQPNYRVKVGKFYYKIKATKALKELKRYFVDAIIVPERIKID